MTNTPEKNCVCNTWARISTDTLPPSDHHKGCEHYKEERFVKVKFDGSYVIVEPINAHEYNDDGMTHEDIFMTRDQFERLPEFEGF